MTEDSDLITRQEAHEAFGIPIRTLDYWLANRKITRYKNDRGHVRVSRTEIQNKQAFRAVQVPVQ